MARRATAVCEAAHLVQHVVASDMLQLAMTCLACDATCLWVMLWMAQAHSPVALQAPVPKQPADMETSEILSSLGEARRSRGRGKRGARAWANQRSVLMNQQQMQTCQLR